VARNALLARLWKPPALVAGLLCAAAFALIYPLRLTGWLETVELMAYDHFLRGRALAQPADARIVLVGASDEDMNRWGWPLSDGLLARTLEKLEAQQPAAIGIDLYRDLPRGEGGEAFEQVMLRHPNIVAVAKIGDGSKGEIPPPPFLGPERVGFADVVLDRADVVRRGLLFLDDGEAAYTGFALRLALLYMTPRGIVIEADPDNPQHLRLGPHGLPPLEPDDGGYVGADAAGYQFLLDYAGGPVPFERLTLSDVLDDRLAAGVLRGRIVIFGVAGQSVKDFFATPFSSGSHAEVTVHGITLHGHIAGQLLRMAVDGVPPLRTLPEFQEAAWIALCCALGGLVGFGLRHPARFGLGFVCGIAAIYAAGYAGMGQRLWVPVVPPMLGWAAAALLNVTYLTVIERRQRDQLMQLFSRHVSGEVAEEIWNNHEAFLSGSGRPLPRRLEVTVLFSDIRGFTTISERLSAEALMDWLNEYTGAMADLVIAHGGMVDKFIGDAVMAIFGAPLPRGSEAEVATDAMRAVDCALAMGEALEALNARWATRGLPPIAIRIGINSGPVVAGSLGSSKRLEYTVIGDTVNTASRLESLDKGWEGLSGGENCRILVSESTMAYLGGYYWAQSMGSVRLKGKDLEVGVFRITGRTTSDAITHLIKEKRI
jgi:adenylate cyclase